MQEIKQDSIPLIILGLAGAFVFASLNNERVLLPETLFFFAYAITSAYARQIYKDVISFSRGKYTDEQKRKWGIYYRVQLGLFIAVFLLVFFVPLSQVLSDLLM